MNRILSILPAFIADLLFRQPTRRGIVAQPAKRPLRDYEEPETTIHLYVLSVVNNYQTASESERRGIVAQPVKLQQPSDGSAASEHVLPLNRGITLSRSLLLGRAYHPLCRQSFVEKVQFGYYAYERREEWRTCALAALTLGCLDRLK